MLLTGCAYYNGMYNAKHYAKQAERSERRGRASEAIDRWRVAAIHAESVVTRHPRSRWAGEAQLIRTRALIHLEMWSDAQLAADRALQMPLGAAQRSEAFLYLGLAYAGLRHSTEALGALDSATRSNDARLRSSALLARGRARLALGLPGEALADFRGSSEEDATFERAHAALAAGDALLAAVYADSLVLRQPFHEAQWLLLLDSLSRIGLLTRASGFADEIRARPDVRSGSKARVLLTDGERLLAAGHDSLAAARFRAVADLVPDSVEARMAALRLERLTIKAARVHADLEGSRHRLEVIASMGSGPGEEARDLLRLMDVADSLEAQAATPDAWWFLRGELLRDSLDAPTLAADAFAAMPDRFPDSPWTPKGILAALALGHPAADSLAALLRGRYADNPYTLAASGRADAPERFAALEDSLHLALVDVPHGGEWRRPDGQRMPAPDEVPGRGRQPASPNPTPQPPRSTSRPSIDP